MCFKIRRFIVLTVITVILGQISCEKFKLYQTDGRVNAVSKSQEVRSLLECSVLFENDIDSLSFNYNKETRICELSNNYVEGSTTFFTGWNVYSPIGKYHCQHFIHFINIIIIINSSIIIIIMIIIIIIFIILSN
jgi:hypothetical protein